MRATGSMVHRPAWLVVVATALLGVPGDVSARVVHMHCLDGLLPTLGRRVARDCDMDGVTDGVCTFALRRCGQLNCGTEGIIVPIRHRRTVRVRNSQAMTTYVLRCSAPPPCDRAHRCTAVTRTCQDDVLGPMQEGQCDIDQEQNSRCLFGFYCERGVCGALVDDVDVPSGGTRMIQSARQPGVGVTRYTLDCATSP
jgi:hypothetical protein